MRAARYGGSNGKSRRARFRRRTEHVYEQQMLAEYFGQRPSAPDRDRYIPIRGRSEFLPTATTGNAMHPSANDQLELPLKTAAADRRRATTQPHRADPAGRPLPAGRFQPLPAPKHRTFTWRGFFSGCAIGATAAGVALLVLQLVGV